MENFKNLKYEDYDSIRRLTKGMLFGQIVLSEIIILTGNYGALIVPIMATIICGSAYLINRRAIRKIKKEMALLENTPIENDDDGEQQLGMGLVKKRTKEMDLTPSKPKKDDELLKNLATASTINSETMILGNDSVNRFDVHGGVLEEKTEKFYTPDDIKEEALVLRRTPHSRRR